MSKATLENVAVRENVDGKWESITLKELCDMGMTGSAFRHAMYFLCGYREGEVITPEQVQKVLDSNTALNNK